MLKKLMNLFMIFLIAIFIYNNYFREQEEVVIDLNKDVETTDVQYKFEDFTVVADKQTDISKSGSSEFNKAKAFFSNSFVKGKTAIVDKINNMVIKDDVFGENKESGWKFDAVQLNYNNKKDIWTTDEGIKAYNEKDEAEITADTFSSNSSFTQMTLKKNVKMIMSDKEVLADEAFFDTEKELLIISGNVSVRNLNINELNEFKEIKGLFPKVTYNMKQGIMSAKGDNTIFYDNYKLTAKQFKFLEKTDKMIIENDVKIVKDDITLTMKKAEYHGQKEKIYLFGKIFGDDKIAEFEADNGEIATTTEDLLLTGNVKISNDSNLILADKVKYTKSKKLIEAYADEGKEVSFENEDSKFFTDYAIYFYDDETLNAPNKYRAAGNQLNGTGSNLIYNLKTEKASSKNIDFTNSDSRIIANKGKFNLLKEYYEIEGNAKLYSDMYIISGNKAIINRAENKAKIPGDYVIVKENETGMKISGKNLEYNADSKLLYSKSKTNVYKTSLNEDLEMSGTSFTYDMNNEIATFENFDGTERKHDFRIEGKEGIYVAGQSVKISGDINYYHNEYTGETDRIIYDLNEEKVYFPFENILKATGKGINGKTQKGEYNINSELFYGEKFTGTNVDANMKSDEINYDYKTQIAKLTGNVTVEENGLKVESEEIIYYEQTNFAVSENDVLITKQNAKLVAADAKLDMNKQVFEANEAVLTTENGDYFKGDYVFGDYLKNEFDIRGNLEATVYTRNEEEINNKELAQQNSPMEFAGEVAKVFFLEQETGELWISRGEIKKDTKFIYEGMDMESEFLEFDIEKEFVFGKGGSSLKLDQGNKIISESIYLDTVNQTGTIREDVKIFNLNDEAGEVNTKADVAFLDNKNSKVNLKGNVEAYKGETKLTADNGVYDLETNLLEGKGNVLFSFDFETIDQQKADTERTEKLTSRLNEVMEKITVPEIIESDTDKIVLPTREEDVIITWESDNKDYISNTGYVKHPSYSASDETVSLKAIFTTSDVSAEKYYYSLVKRYSNMEYLEKISSEFKIDNDSAKIYIPEKYKNASIKVIKKSENISESMLLPEDLNEEMELELQFSLDDKFTVKKYKSKYINNVLSFEEVEL